MTHPFQLPFRGQLHPNVKFRCIYSNIYQTRCQIYFLMQVYSKYLIFILILDSVGDVHCVGMCAGHSVGQRRGGHQWRGHFLYLSQLSPFFLISNINLGISDYSIVNLTLCSAEIPEGGTTDGVFR